MQVLPSHVLLSKSHERFKRRQATYFKRGIHIARYDHSAHTAVTQGASDMQDCLRVDAKRVYEAITSRSDFRLEAFSV